MVWSHSGWAHLGPVTGTPKTHGFGHGCTNWKAWKRTTSILPPQLEPGIEMHWLYKAISIPNTLGEMPLTLGLWLSIAWITGRWFHIFTLFGSLERYFHSEGEIPNLIYHVGLLDMSPQQCVADSQISVCDRGIRTRYDTMIIHVGWLCCISCSNLSWLQYILDGFSIGFQCSNALNPGLVSDWSAGWHHHLSWHAICCGVDLASPAVPEPGEEWIGHFRNFPVTWFDSLVHVVPWIYYLELTIPSILKK